MLFNGNLVLLPFFLLYNCVAAVERLVFLFFVCNCCLSNAGAGAV